MGRIKMTERIGEHLAIRSAVSDMFKDDDVRDDDIVVDFAGVKSIGRSFAHEYVSCRSRHRHNVAEVNQSDHVATMLRIAANPKPGPRKPLITGTETTVISG